ncbi:prenyltransferase [Rhodococcus sp. Leaf7]|uniref:prenyltransferase n=1 Tax=unclassified Rhodococcus (in: high G+C Gram-positive bacteria) TaxID=192944 RepID=UPI0006F7B3BC|nr:MULTISPECIES: prenyltransferase [unclassified Rhodococcus (in: high G+C Gram-positive bacteria)]KQU06568.1 prenyltransferase [Rhodococcus sp. Leaf7]KQU42086.1 prenyltransferase [Rhodococcus sp. Leaf247]
MALTEHAVPSVPDVLTAEQCLESARSIAAVQLRSGAVPWSDGGHLDPWDHVEAAMALSAAGLVEEADAAYEWSRRTQRDDGTWPIRMRGSVVEDAGSDTNFCAYIAVGVWHHFLVTGDDNFALALWPTVRRAVDFVLSLQSDRGEIAWAAGPNGSRAEALLTGNASIHHSLRCALALAAYIGDPQPDWEVAVGRLGHVLRHHDSAFTPKPSYSMDWYYPILGGAVRGPAALRRIDERWTDFVVDGLGIRCVDDRPWVTGAETCELVLTLDAMDRRDAAVALLANMQHLRESDGSYWTGLVYADGKRWPVERTTWTTGAMILAADALSRSSAGSGIFRGDDLPVGLSGAHRLCGCAGESYPASVPG